MLLIPLVLSAFTHLWNPTGFPDIFYDEGVYMRRAMSVMQGFGPQEGNYYDHPFFGQLFLAGVLTIVGYPGPINADGTVQSMEALYLAPRVLMGLLAVADTFLVFKIAEKRYGRRVALIASIAFAVLPITWLFRRILLDSILLPFLLSSILVALHVKDGRHPVMLALAAGALLGLAIFTKIPAFTMIPLVGFLVASQAGGTNRVGRIAAFLAPTLLIPMIWPLYSVSVGEFDDWMQFVVGQAQRQSGGIVEITRYFFHFDPVLLVAGGAGVAYSLWRRDAFVALWVVPFVIFLSVIGYVQYFHWMPVLPVFAIALGRLASDLLAKTRRKAIPFATVAAMAVFGIVSTSLLITADLTSAQFEALAYASAYLRENDNGRDVTTLASPVYSWVLRDVYGYENVWRDYSLVLFQRVRTENTLLIADSHFMIDTSRGPQLQAAYDRTSNLQVFEDSVGNYDGRVYPYGSMNFNREGQKIEVRA
jgi:4-amino-4-deoxy-L-arabinose transferase-like glycosyltransferase